MTGYFRWYIESTLWSMALCNSGRRLGLCTTIWTVNYEMTNSSRIAAVGSGMKNYWTDNATTGVGMWSSSLLPITKLCKSWDSFLIEIFPLRNDLRSASKSIMSMTQNKALSLTSGSSLDDLFGALLRVHRGEFNPTGNLRLCLCNRSYFRKMR